MKTKHFLPAALAALSLLSCNREPLPTDGTPVQVNVSILPAASTRSATPSSAEEAAVSTLQVYVFNNGKLEDYRKVDGDTNATVTATAGERTVWALVNAPVISGITTEEGLRTKTSRLEDNRIGSFVMSGSTTTTLTNGGTVGITVRRIVSRVSIRKITHNLPYSLATEPMTIKGIYLINVAADNVYTADGTPGAWVNMLGHNETAYDALLYDALSKSIEGHASYTTEHVFYPYPNPTVESSYADTWGPRHTMLVVEVTFEGEQGYYPVELPVLERNKSYVIEEIVLLHRPGDKPYKPIETGSATVKISVHDWEDGENLGTVNL